MTRRIQIIEDKLSRETAQARHDFGVVTGNPIRPKPSVFEDTRTGIIYNHIAGAMAWPTAEPGCIFIVGILSTESNGGRPRLDVIEFQEHPTVSGLVDAMVRIRQDFGHGLDDHTLRQWVGDPERYQPILVKRSVSLEMRQGYDRGLYVREPAEFKDRYAFPLYMRQLRAALKEKVLNLNSHAGLLGRLQSFPHDAVEKGDLHDHPAVGMLGAFVHTLMIETPWQEEMDLPGEEEEF